MANELEQAWNDLQSTPSYVQRYANDPFLYQQEEENLFNLVVIVEISDIFVDAAHVAAEKAGR